MTDGVSTVVYRAERGSERFYLRVLPEVGATFAPEVRAHQFARALGCAVPEVLAYEACDPGLGRSLMLTSEIPGHPLSDDVAPADAEAIVRAAGRDLARINSIPVDGLGWVDRSSEDIPESITAEHHDRAGILAAEYRPVIEQLSGGAVPRIEPERLSHGLSGALEAVRPGSGPVLVHGDFDTTHIFVHDGRYSGIIDFGEIRGMPRCYDLGHHLMHDRERLPYSTISWLIEGYAEIKPLPDDHPRQISAWSGLIAARALCRGLLRNPESPIVATARRSLTRSITEI
ncbi:hypothetical protein BH23CHL2_BH23CHL2_14230 [soil metagenome]